MTTVLLTALVFTCFLQSPAKDTITTITGSIPSMTTNDTRLMPCGRVMVTCGFALRKKLDDYDMIIQERCTYASGGVDYSCVACEVYRSQYILSLGWIRQIPRPECGKDFCDRISLSNNLRTDVHAFVIASASCGDAGLYRCRMLTRGRARPTEAVEYLDMVPDRVMLTVSPASLYENTILTTMTLQCSVFSTLKVKWAWWHRKRPDEQWILFSNESSVEPASWELCQRPWSSAISHIIASEDLGRTFLCHAIITRHNGQAAINISAHFTLRKTGARFLSNVFTFITIMFVVETNLLTWLLVCLDENANIRQSDSVRRLRHLLRLNALLAEQNRLILQMQERSPDTSTHQHEPAAGPGWPSAAADNPPGTASVGSDPQAPHAHLAPAPGTQQGGAARGAPLTPSSPQSAAQGNSPAADGQLGVFTGQESSVDFDGYLAFPDASADALGAEVSTDGQADVVVELVAETGHGQRGAENRP